MESPDSPVLRLGRIFDSSVANLLADSIESTSTAIHNISPTFPAVPSATGGSVVVGAIVTVVIAQKIIRLVGG